MTRPARIAVVYYSATGSVLGSEFSHSVAPESDGMLPVYERWSLSSKVKRFVSFIAWGPGRVLAAPAPVSDLRPS
jgi:hypothetical protein